MVHGRGRKAIQRLRLRHYPAELWVRPDSSDLDVALQVFLARDYDLSADSPYQEHIQQVSSRIRQDGSIPVIIDAGANIGASTLWFSLHFPECHIFAIEPDAGNFAMLTRNVAARPNVTLVQAGLWDHSTSLALKSEHDDSWARRVQENVEQSSAIPSVTVPELLHRNPKFRLLIAKIDIEGAETAVFRSNTEWVDTVPLLIFEPHDNFWHWLGKWQSSAHAFFSVLTRHKREYLFKGENVFALLHPEPP